MKNLLHAFVLMLFLFTASSAFSQTSWKGVTSTNWATVTNWTAGVPLATTDVIIGDANFTGAYQPAISATAAAKSLTIGGAVASQLTVAKTLTVKGDINITSNGSLINGAASITLTGSWINDGSYTTTSTSATVIFGGIAQNLGGSVVTTFRKLTVNTGSILTLNNNLTCAGASSLIIVAGTLNPNESPSYLTTTDNLTVNKSAVLKITANLFASNYIITTTFSLLSGSIVEYGATAANQVISSSYSYSTLRISGAGSVKTLAADLPSLQSASSSAGYLYVLSGTLDLAGYTANRGTTVAGGVLSVSNGAVLKIGGTTSFPANYLTNTLSLTSTVEYNGNDQPVAAKTYGNLVLSASSGAVTKTMPVTAFTVAGSLTSNVGAGTSVAYAAASNISITGSINIGASTNFNGNSFSHSITGSWNNNGTFTSGTSTVTLKGASTFISGTALQNFNNLTITGSNITAPGITNINISGNLATSGSGAFTQAAPATLSMTGTTKTITGTFINLDNLDISGVVTTTATVTMSGNMFVSGSFIASSGTYTMNGASKSITNNGTLTLRALVITGSVSTISNFTIAASLNCTGSLLASAGTITFTGTNTLSGTVSLNSITVNASSLTLSANSVLGIAGAFTLTAGTFNVTSYIPNTVNYNGTGSQTVKGGAYNNLVLSNGAVKTAGAAITINNVFTISPSTTFAASTFTHTVVKNWVNNGTFTAGTSTIQFTGASNSTISGASTFNNITVNKTLATYTVSLLDNINVSTIAMTLGTLNTGVNTITITTTRTGNGIILGTITRTHAFAAAVAYAFEGPNNLITFAAGVSGVTSVTLNVSTVTPIDFPYNGSVARVYNITIPTGTYTATLRLHYEDAELNGNDEAIMQLWKYNGAAWAVSGKTANSTTSNYVEKNNLTNISGRWTMTDDGSVLNWNGSVSSDWNTAANWTLVQGTFSGVPAGTDIVQIGVAAFTNQPIITSAALAKSITLGSTQAIALTLNSGGSLTVNGNVNGVWNSNAIHTINVNSQTLTIAGDLNLSDNSSNHVINLNIGTGIVTVSGTLTESGGSNITFTAAGTLNIGKDFLYSSGTFTPSTSLVKYTGTASQVVAAVPYGNLTIIKTAGTIASLSNATSLTGNLIITTGELDIFDVLDVTGSVTISAGSVLDANASVMNVGGNWTKAATGTYNSETSTVNFNGNGTQTISAGFFNILNFNKSAGTAVLSGNNTVNGNLSLSAGTLNLSTYTLNQSSVGDVFTIADGTTLLVSGSNNFPANFTTYTLGNNSLVHYNGTIAQVAADVVYGNVSFSNGAALEKTFAGSSTINGNIIINSGASLNGATYIITLLGNWTNNGTFNAGTGDILLNGSSKTLTGSTTFYDVTVNGSYTVATSDMAFNGHFQVTATGSYTAGSGVATVNGDFTNSGIAISSGTTTFTGTVLQNIRLVNALQSTSTGIVNFNGTISPDFNSTSTPTFATVNINNTAGINPSVNWVTLVAFNVSAGATFNGGASTHTFGRAFTNNGIVTSSGTMNFNPTSAVTLQLSGTSFSSTGKIIFGGSGAVTVTGNPTALQDVVIANTNAAGITAPGGWILNGNLSINSNAAFNAGTFNHSVAGNIECNGVLNGNTSTFTMSAVAGELSGSPGTVFNNLILTGNITGNSDFNVAGNFTNNGTYDGSLGALIMTGNTAATIGGTTNPSTIDLLTINKSGGAIVTSNVNISSITGLNIFSGTLFTSTYSIAQNPAGGVIVIAAGATLKLGGTNTIPAFSGYGFDEQSTVEYAGAAQTIANGPVYGNLLISAAGNKTAPSFLPLTIAGNITITAGNFIANNNTHKVAGNWIMNGGTFNNANSVIRFNGVNDQIIETIAPFNSVNINKFSGAVNLSSDITVNGILSFSSGKIETGNYTVIVPSTGSVTGAAQNTGWINGNLQKNVSTGTAVSRTFEVGSASYFSPATILFASVGTAGNVIASATATDHTQVDYSGIDSTRTVNRFWSISNAGIVFTTATTTFNWVASDLDAGVNTANFKAAIFDGTAWTLKTIASPLATSIQATALTAFGDFEIGEQQASYKWTGEGFTADWNLAKNWSGGIPTTAYNTLIPNGISGGRLYPILSSGTGAVSNLTIDNAASLSVNTATLQIAGAITNNGTLNASQGTIEYNGLSAQIIAAGTFQNNLIKDLTVNNNLSLGGATYLTGTLTVANGKTLTTNDNLVLRSNAAGTARVANLPVNGSGIATAFITGNVSIERYLPLRKAWRMLSAPVKAAGAPSINAAWQEAVTTASGTPNPNPGYGVHITGGSVANGFDQGLTAATTIKVFNNVSGFVALPAAGTNTAITNYPGYFLYVRGDRSINLLAGNNAAVTATTLRMKGQLNTGSQTSNVNAIGYTILGNPFASAIDFGTLTRTNVKNSFYVWDPKLSGTYGLGGYVTFSYNSGTGNYDATTAASPVSKYIPSGEAIIIESADGINPGTVTIKESDKTASGSDQVFGRSNGLDQQVRVNMFSINADGTTALLDGVLTTYDDDNLNTIDNSDAYKLNGGSENIGIKRSGKMLAIERRQTVTANDTTFLNIYQMKVQSYKLEITMNNMSVGVGAIALLRDSYSNTINNTALDMNGTTNVSFNVNADPASYSLNRFSIVFAIQAPLPVTFKTIKAYKQQKNINVEWSTDNEINIKEYDLERSKDGRMFTKLHTTPATASNGGSAIYSFLDTDPFQGNNYYRVRSSDHDGKTGYSSIVKVSMESAESLSTVTIFPNPVKGKVVGLQLNNIAKGNYTIQLFNSAGQLIALKKLQHNGGSASESLEINSAFAAGKFELLITGENLKLATAVIKK